MVRTPARLLARYERDSLATAMLDCAAHHHAGGCMSNETALIMLLVLFPLWPIVIPILLGMIVYYLIKGAVERKPETPSEKPAPPEPEEPPIPADPAGASR